LSVNLSAALFETWCAQAFDEWQAAADRVIRASQHYLPGINSYLKGPDQDPAAAATRNP
jgi:hypothetical protein